MKVYFFGWPGRIGGADTKLAHLLPLLRPEVDLVVVPPCAKLKRDPFGRELLDGLGIPCPLLEELPPKLEGWGIALCHGEFLSSGTAAEARRRGLRLAWSNEMMCLFPTERGALTLGLCDAVLYVSDAQRKALEPQYQRIISGSLQLEPLRTRPEDVEGWIAGRGTGRKLRWVMTGNYIDPGAFPFREPETGGRQGQPLVIGRLSRPDPAKFPLDFPTFYEGLGLRQPRYRVMAWSPQLAARWPRHVFDARWDLLPSLAESASAFLRSLDLFVYSLHPSCRESWGRAVVEAMLSGAVPLVPAGEQHHLESLISPGETGFVCRTAADYGRYARQLENDPGRRSRLARQARAFAEKHLCNPAHHRDLWRRLFYGSALA